MWGLRDRGRAVHYCKVNLVKEDGGMSGDLYIFPSILNSELAWYFSFQNARLSQVHFIRSVKKGKDIDVPGLMKR